MKMCLLCVLAGLPAACSRRGRSALLPCRRRPGGENGRLSARPAVSVSPCGPHYSLFKESYSSWLHATAAAASARRGIAGCMHAGRRHCSETFWCMQRTRWLTGGAGAMHVNSWEVTVFLHGHGVTQFAEQLQRRRHEQLQRSHAVAAAMELSTGCSGRGQCRGRAAAAVVWRAGVPDAVPASLSCLSVCTMSTWRPCSTMWPALRARQFTMCAGTAAWSSSS